MSVDVAGGGAARSTGRIRLLENAAVLPRHGTESLTGVARHDLPEHRRAYGQRLSCLGHRGDDLLAAMEAVHLTGRGGGHFPAAAKWRSVAANGPGGTVVVNGAEGEPGCAKDAVLLQTRPHLVLDGLVAAMEVIGAAEGVVWIHDGAWRTAQSVTHALAERHAAGEGDPPIRVIAAPDRYLSGEATGIIRTLEGGPTLPRWVADPARPWSQGQRPVLVNNAETMARAALLAHVGVEGYTPTSLLTVINDTYRAVLEVGGDETFGDVVANVWRSPDGREPQAVLLGGYGGSWVAWDRIRHLPVDNGALREHGLSIGAGLVGPLPANACGIEESGRLLRYLADQSARQCGPCLFGLAAASALVDDLTAGKLSRSGRLTLDKYVGEISGRGACRHPDGALRMLTSGFAVFHDDVHRHRRGRTCDAPNHSIMPLPEDRS
ncbi:MAG: NADH-ubiquinone oxidoreductase-F iron-sulfur binding region domain-containing protein [Candidatus Nanopelagicales bacterium]